jgi:hypothetical protein
MLLVLLEICYNILYVEKYGRPLSDPWSLRQTGVYHQLNKNLTSSHWILLNLAHHTRLDLEGYFQSTPNQFPLSLHVQLLTLLGSNWTEYIEYLGSALRNLVGDVAHVIFPDVDSLTDTG